MSAAYRPSRAERRAVARLRRQLTPEASTHRAYLQEVAAYVAECRAPSPRLVHDGRVGRVTELEVRRSRLFGRRYLVAYVERSWYRAVAPTSDAIVSTLSGVDALPPLVILPHRRRHESLEAMFVAGWRGEFRPRDLTTFLDHLPRRFRRWLDELRVSRCGTSPGRVRASGRGQYSGQGRRGSGRPRSTTIGRAAISSTAWAAARHDR